MDEITLALEPPYTLSAILLAQPTLAVEVQLSLDVSLSLRQSLAGLFVGGRPIESTDPIIGHSIGMTFSENPALPQGTARFIVP